MKTIQKASSIVIFVVFFLYAKPEVKMGVIPINVACRSFGSGNRHFKHAYSTMLNTKQVACIGA